MLWLISQSMLHAQKLKNISSYIRFYSEAPLEDIEAKNEKAVSIIDLDKKQFAFRIPIKEFEFENALMQEHFNENYMETEKFPTATFVGNLIGFDQNTDPNSNDNPQKVIAKGKLTIHGVTKEIKVKGSIGQDGDEWSIDCSFKVKLEDYDIKIPKLVVKKIAEVVEVYVQCNYLPEEQVK